MTRACLFLLLAFASCSKPPTSRPARTADVGAVSAIDGGTFASISPSEDFASGEDARLPAVEVVLGTPSVEGDVDAKDLEADLRRNLPAIEYCYAKGLAVEPGLKGTLVAAFTIDERGRASGITVSAMNHLDVETCVAQQIRAMPLPRPRSGSSAKATVSIECRPVGQ